MQVLPGERRAKLGRLWAVQGWPTVTADAQVTSVGVVYRQPDAVLCRSNIDAMAQFFRFLAKVRRVALAGKPKPCALGSAARQ